jgi:hypothetical protein
MNSFPKRTGFNGCLAERTVFEKIAKFLLRIPSDIGAIIFETGYAFIGMDKIDEYDRIVRQLSADIFDGTPTVWIQMFER